ncbi:GTP-binding protein Rho1 [Serendipita sp. 405]|nr:GTP-binding protein Rho1 [Serendipita sp. 405]
MSETITLRIPKVVVTGDKRAGKTCLLTRYISETYSNAYTETPLNDHLVEYGEGQAIILSDTEVYNWEMGRTLRLFNYIGASVVVACFGVDDPESLSNVEKIWVPEVRVHNTTAPILLVGCKADVRHDQEELRRLALSGIKTISMKEGRAVAKRVGAVAYIECSAKTGKGVGDVFSQAIGLSFHRRPTIKRSVSPCGCIIL